VGGSELMQLESIVNKSTSDQNAQFSVQNYKVGVIQMVSEFHWRTNLSTALSLMETATAAGAKLLVLPENWVVFHGDGYQQFAKNPDLSAQVMDALSRFAAEQRVWVCTGSIPFPPESKQPNAKAMTRCSLISDAGKVVADYDKLHLFSAQVDDAHCQYDEGRWFFPGHQPVVVNTPLGVIGMAICYDLRFPELFRWMAHQGAQLFLVPSAFTHATGQAHWSVLTQARAVENLAYVIAANQGGEHFNQRQTWGHSCVVDPWGTVLAQKPSGAGVILAEVDINRIQMLRHKMPVLSHARLEISGSVVDSLSLQSSEPKS